MAGRSRLDAEEIAEAVMRDMIQTGRWEELRIQLASILQVNGDYKAAKIRAQEILSTDQLKIKMRQRDTTESDIAGLIEKNGGLRRYRSALTDLLAPDTPTGSEIQRELNLMVDKYIDEHPL
jgi:hypothetical protein